jgi:hypothetical protein
VKIWKIGKLRPITVLVGLHAEAWKERIARKHLNFLPEDLSGHPQGAIEATLGLVLSANHKRQDMPWVAIIHRLEALYVLNNCIYAFALGDRGILGVVGPEFRLDPKKIIAYQCDSETEEPVCISDPETGWIDERPLGQYGEQLQIDLNRISIFLEGKRIQNIGKKAPRVINTSKKEPKLDHDKIAKALGVKRMIKRLKNLPRRIP